MHYRREIDGLRAVAVLPVILFHGGFGWFSGGYVGVDVFFVISGYLITSIILAEKKAETFTLAGFYERRARRILPPLFLVLTVSTAFAWFFLLPNQIKELSRSLIAISIFASNILFGREANYFATAAELNPLLHTWSLAVEEQFYAVFPLFILLLWPVKKRWSVGFLAVSIVGCLSFIYADTRSVSAPEITFYLLKARCWELFLGGSIAFLAGLTKTGAPYSLTSKINESGSLLGIFLIAYAVVAFDKGTRFPGAYALVPTVGTALVILFAIPSTLVGRVLSHRWLVGLGLISYSAYLWHQPLFAFSRLLSLGGHWTMAILAICSIVLAYFTWRFVERPFRDRTRTSRKTILLAAIAMNATTLLTGLVLDSNNGFPERISDTQAKVLAFRAYPTTELYRTGKCLLKIDQPPSAFSPECGAAGDGSSEEIFLWGDSFAAHLYPAVKELSRSTVSQYSSVCPPLIGVQFDYGRDCADVELYILEKIRRHHPSLVVISANWRKHAKYLANIGPTIERIHLLSANSRILLVGNVPHWEPSLPEILARSRTTLELGLRFRNSLLQELRLVDTTLREAASAHGARFVAPIEFFCELDDCLVVASDHGALEPIAYDYGHLTKGGSDLLVKGVMSSFRNPTAKAN
ncbi:MAG TPA: acyltransferase family protein [Burkholderiales bacterium]|nr:acyltransferase family protein [Burkholderiales bacterium]